jgi:hypothetical protein
MFQTDPNPSYNIYREVYYLAQLLKQSERMENINGGLGLLDLR